MEGERILCEKEGNEICRAARDGAIGVVVVVEEGEVTAIAGGWLWSVPAVFIVDAGAGFLVDVVDVVIGPCIVRISQVLSWLEWLHVLASLVVGVPA